jgi:hypothetical protein
MTAQEKSRKAVASVLEMSEMLGLVQAGLLELTAKGREHLSRFDSKIVLFSILLQLFSAPQ